MKSREDGLRIDLWLKFACLFKHRNQATQACQGGKVRLNEGRAKPSSIVRVGDVIEVQRDRLQRYVVLETPPRQVARKDAAALYRDESPAVEPEQIVSRARAGVAQRDQGAGRPTKRERRELERLRGK